MRSAPGLTRVAIVLVSAAIVSLIACSRRPPQEEIWRSQCMRNLSNLGKFAWVHADEHENVFPLAEGESPRAHATLQVLLDAMPDARVPKMFVCPGSKETPAGRGGDVLLHLAENNVSYAWRGKALKLAPLNSPDEVLACDKTLDNHGGAGVCVLYADAAVKFLTKDELGEGGLEGFIARHELVR